MLHAASFPDSCHQFISAARFSAACLRFALLHGHQEVCRRWRCGRGGWPCGEAITARENAFNI